MQLSLAKFTLARTALLTASALMTSAALADTALTTYNSGDLFIGFRQTGVTNTLVVKVGAAGQFLPANLGGTWDGTPFKVTFGLVPGSAAIVDDLSADLVANFGVDWADNFTDGTGVRWGVVGITSNNQDNVPINGYNARTAFVTKARTTPTVQSTTFASSNLDNFAVEFSSFAFGLGGGSYVNQNSTANSSVTFIGDGTQTNNWNTKIAANGTFGLGSGRVVEQLNSGTFQGTTNSVLDLYVLPSADSTITGARTYTGGSFTLNSQGELFYSPVPEPGSATLAAAATLVSGLVRYRRRSR